MQDSLQHIDPAATAPVPEGEATHAPVARPRKVWKAKADTLQADSAANASMNTAATTAKEKPQRTKELFPKDYWTDGLAHTPRTQLLVDLQALRGDSDTLVALQAPRGVAGTALPYRLQNDTGVTACLMLSLFLIVWVLSRSRHYLKGQIKGFFQPSRGRENLFAARTENELRGQAFLLFETCFLLSILVYTFAPTALRSDLPPRLILGGGLVLWLAYFLLKLGLYAWVNTTFFDREKRKQFSDAYMLTVLALGVALLPLALLVVYFRLGADALLFASVCLLGVDKLLLLVKTHRTFFNRPAGLLHLFLYFCTLELMPLFFLYEAIQYLSTLHIAL